MLEQLAPGERSLVLDPLLRRGVRAPVNFTSPQGTDARQLVGSDMNGDGELDLAVAGFVDDAVLFNQGNGVFTGPARASLRSRRK